MDMQEVKELVESRGMVYKGEFLSNVTEEEFSKGMRKVNLPEIDDLDSPNGEGVWVYVQPEDRDLYDGYSKGNIINVILANTSLYYPDIIFWGSEVPVRLNGTSRPTLSKEWVTEKILESDWFIND